MKKLQKFLSHPIYAIIEKVADRLQVSTYVIGGIVRDIFLDRPSKDVDILVIGNRI